MEDKYKCPWCGSEDYTYGVQTDDARVKPAKSFTFVRDKLILVICKNCGTVIRSYVQHPEKFE